MTPTNVIYLNDHRHPDGEVIYLEEYKDLWLAVISQAVADYRRGILRGQHLKLDNPIHSSHADALQYSEWVEAAHWLLSENTGPRSFRWVAVCIGFDPDLVLSRVNLSRTVQ